MSCGQPVCYVLIKNGRKNHESAYDSVKSQFTHSISVSNVNENG